MPELNQQSLIISGVIIVVAVFLFQLAVTFYLAFSLKIAARERTQLNKEMFGLVRKLEGLTSSKRELMLRHYDGILERLAAQLPPLVAAQTSNAIFDTESKILKRLAELEPNLKEDKQALQKMDELVHSMEGLERTVVSLTSEAVERVMVESRRSFMDDEEFVEVGSLRSN